MQKTNISPEILQPFFECAANAADKGQSQFFTPLELGRQLAQSLPRHRPVLVDLNCGAGHLLQASARDQSLLLGADIDPCRGQTVEGATHQLSRITSDAGLLHAWLKEVGFRADCLVLNPPWRLFFYRARLAALVSRSPDLDPRLIVSATVESLAENLTDSVVSPLLYYALFGLPGALAYRAVNTMDAMIGYRDEREHVGKAAARTDDVANWVPTRIAGVLLVATAGLKGRARRAWRAFRTEHLPEYGPNKTLAIATMAGALGVQLQKPGAYALGTEERPLVAAVIGDAASMVWVAGGATVVLAAGLAGLLSWAVS